jgi:hypothetical protein
MTPERRFIAIPTWVHIAHTRVVVVAVRTRFASPNRPIVSLPETMATRRDIPAA